MEHQFLSRKQKRKMERRQKKEKKNEYYMNRFSKNKFNKKNKFKNNQKEEISNNKNKNQKTNIHKNKSKKEMLFNEEKIDIDDIDLEKIGEDKNKKINIKVTNKKEKENIKQKEKEKEKVKDDIDLDLEYLEKKLNLKNSDIMDKYKKSMALENYDEDIFDFLDNIDSSVQKGLDKYKKYDPNNFNKKKDKKEEDIKIKNKENDEEEENEEEEDEFENMEEGEELEDNELNEELDEENENEELEEENEEEKEKSEEDEENEKQEEEGGEYEEIEEEEEKENKKEEKKKEKEIVITKEMKQQNELLINQFKKELTSLLNKVAESNLSLILPAIFSKISSFMDSYQDPNKISKTKITYEIISEILIKTIIYQQVINLPIISCICSIISLLHFIKFGQSFLFFFIKKCLEELNFLNINNNNKTNIEKYKYKNFFFIVIHLYIFENINSVFIYDLIKYLIDNFDENNSEYLLLLLSYTGINIRKENPTNLKDIIILINMKYNDIKITNDSNKTEKIKYIIDMINDIKQNKYLKFNLQEKFNFFKELIKKNKSESSVINDKLEIDLNKIMKLPYDQIFSSEVIANNEKIEEIVNLDTDDLIIKETKEDSKTNAQLNLAMKKMGISTKLKKMIFINIATSSGVNDAFERLSRLNLNKEQKREIIKMICKLCIEEPSYNPFYELLMEKLLTFDKDNKYTFHYCIWDYMKILENFKIKKIHNLSKLTANLLIKEKISIPVLLQFKFEEDKNENKNFVNMVLNKYFNDSTEDKTKLIFAKLVRNDDHVEFAKKLFNYLAKDFSNENNIEQKEENYQINLGSALKVLKKVL